MWRPMCPILASTSLLVICAAAAHAQTFAPSTLEVARHDQKSANDMVQVITDDSARAFVGEPVRPMNQPTVSKREQPASHFTFKTPGGKKESAPVISQYYPKQMVYPFGKVDRHLDSRLMQAASIAQERAHAHSRSRCWHYVKEALLASGAIDSRPKTELARDAAQELVSN